MNQTGHTVKRCESIGCVYLFTIWLCNNIMVFELVKKTLNIKSQQLTIIANHIVYNQFEMRY
jgi:hypothetical protein